MATNFELVKEDGLSALLDQVRNSTTSSKQFFSNYLLSSLAHFYRSGKKVKTLQASIDALLEIRYRDLEVIELSLRALTPIDFKMEEAHGKKKWIVLKGEKAASDNAKDGGKAVKEANKFKWANSFENFAKGEAILLGNAAFFKGCNDGKQESDPAWIKEKLEVVFDQDVYALVDHMKQTQVDKSEAAKIRAGETTKELSATQKVVDRMLAGVKPFNKAVDKAISSANDLNASILEAADARQLNDAEGIVLEMEKKLNSAQQKLAAARNLINDRRTSAKVAELSEMAPAFLSGLSVEQLQAALASAQEAQLAQANQTASDAQNTNTDPSVEQASAESVAA